MSETTPSQWAARLLRHLPHPDDASALTRHATDEDLAAMQVLDHLDDDRVARVVQACKAGAEHMVSKITDPDQVSRLAADPDRPHKLRMAAACSPLCDPQVKLQLFEQVAARNPQAATSIALSDADPATTAAMLAHPKLRFERHTGIPSYLPPKAGPLVDLAVDGSSAAVSALQVGIERFGMAGYALANPRSHELPAALLLAAVSRAGNHPLAANDPAWERLAGAVDAVDGLEVALEQLPAFDRTPRAFAAALSRALAERRIRVTGRDALYRAARPWTGWLRTASHHGVPLVLDELDVRLFTQEGGLDELRGEVTFANETAVSAAATSPRIPLRVMALRARPDADHRKWLLRHAVEQDRTDEVVALSPTADELAEMLTDGVSPAGVLRLLDACDLQVTDTLGDAILAAAGTPDHTVPPALLDRVPAHRWDVATFATIDPRRMPTTLPGRIFAVDPQVHGDLDVQLLHRAARAGHHVVLDDVMAGTAAQQLDDDRVRELLAEHEVARQVVGRWTSRYLQSQRTPALEDRLVACLPLAGLDDGHRHKLAPLVAERMTAAGATPEAWTTLVSTLGTWDTTVADLVSTCIALALPQAS